MKMIKQTVVREYRLTWKEYMKFVLPHDVKMIVDGGVVVVVNQ